jgi:hypothetical protein
MKRNRSKEAIEAASKTYRKATTEVARRLLKSKPSHTKYPSEDFQEVLGLAEAKMEEKELEWYRRGLVRGLTKTTDWLLDGTISYKGDHLEAPQELEINVRIRLSGKGWESRQFTIKASEIGFD